MVLIPDLSLTTSPGPSTLSISNSALLSAPVNETVNVCMLPKSSPLSSEAPDFSKINVISLSISAIVSGCSISFI